MNDLLKTQSHPLCFFLYLELGLLTIAIAAISLSLVLVPQLWLPNVLELLILAVFGLMGVMLPKGNTYKILYICLSFSLVLAWLALGGELWLLQLLLLILVIRSCFVLPLSLSWAVAGLVLAIALLARVQNLASSNTTALWNQPEQNWLSQYSDILWFGIVLLLVIQLMHSVLAAQKMQQELARSQQRWRQYTQQHEELAALKARHHIAYTNYDALGHAVIAINIQLQSALKLWSINPGQAQNFLAQAQQLGVTTMQEIRNSVRALRIHNVPPCAELSYETKDEDTR